MSEREISSSTDSDKFGMGAGASVVEERQSQQTGAQERRIADIERILNTQPVDLDALHTISRREGGFISHELRQRIWPKFLGINRYETDDYRLSSDKEVTRKIRCDIERSFWNYSHCKTWSEELLRQKRGMLSDMITATLSRNENLQYYQGFHDVACVFIEVCDQDQDLAFALIEAMSKYFMCDYMGEDFKVVTGVLPLILQIVKIVDGKLYAHLSKALNEPYFALSWLITWFSHDLKDLDVAARTFDALITSHPLFGLYMCTAVVLSCKTELLAIECEMSQVHNFLVNVFERKVLCFDRIVSKADKLMEKLPPSKLQVLACGELRGLIDQKRVAIFKKPPCITRYCDSDAVLLEQFKKRKAADVELRAQELETEHEKAAAALEESTAEFRLGSSTTFYWLGSAVLGGIVSLVSFRSAGGSDS